RFAEDLRKKPWLKGLLDALDEAERKLKGLGKKPTQANPFAWAIPRLDELAKGLEGPLDAFRQKAAEVFSLRNIGVERSGLDNALKAGSDWAAQARAAAQAWDDMAAKMGKKTGFAAAF